MLLGVNMNEWLERKLTAEQKNRIKIASIETGTSYDDYLKAIEEHVVWSDSNVLVLEQEIKGSVDIIIARYAEQPEYADE